MTTDTVGNLIKNAKDWTYAWEHGRELVSLQTDSATWTYTYDADGMRKTKTVNGVTHTYYYTGGKLLREVYDGTILDFFYDANGTPLAMRQSAVGSTNYTIYYYITNLQGDVIRLVDVFGNTAAYYRYDPYGKVIEASGSHANINPLRYRSYYYDTESGLYYLQSRYYDPQICRFINADSLVTTGNGMVNSNMFAYCLNNPVNGCDPCGTCFHRLDFWKDCERCAGKTWDEKLNILAADIYDYATDVYDAHMMQIESQQQVDQNSFRAMRDSATAIWDAHEHNVELEAQKQYNQDMEVRAQWEDIFRSPTRTGDFVVMTISNVSAYASYYAAASAGAVTFLGGLGLGITIGCAVWSTLRYYEIIDE